ncbi:hypothetical protein SG0102_07540 [Intestinibaculum porci]|uniref:DUF7601 domain-containing protein n=1 Tax=Intestinibaculum porci TaxID=2487118 RepID=A0A3G9J3U2_9FIRM|nr:hypothetical protein [Intestinibaculum porci]BBH25820.1 hypothetical protein SG0102_07540 [Intestinibaculum porci]
MKTKTRKTTRILCASSIAAMTLLGSVAPALTTVAAEGSTTAATVGDTTTPNQISFDKKILLDKNENVPNTTISYEATPRAVGSTEKDALEHAGFHNVVDDKTPTFTLPTLNATTTFSTNDDNDVSIDPTTGKKSITKQTNITASSLVSLVNKPTVFTYTLTESTTDGFITDSEGKTRKLNIFVGYRNVDDENSHTLSVVDYTLADENGDKKSGFVNNYLTSDNPDPDPNKNTKAIKVTKKVTGNQGDQTKYFDFKVTITGQHSKVTATNSGDSKVNDTTPTASNSTVIVTTQLKHGESLTLKGLTKGAEYKVEEIDPGEYESLPGTPHDVGDNTAETVVTNTKNGTLPTGIYLNHKLPFNILGVALAGGAVALIAKKRHEDVLEDEDDE